MPIRTLPLHANGHQIYPNPDIRVMDFEAESEPGAPLPPMLADHLYECGWCGTYFAPRVTEDGVYVDEPCKYNQDLTTVIQLKVPSGKLIVTDDMRPVYNGFDHDDSGRKGFASYNSHLSRRREGVQPRRPWPCGLRSHQEGGVRRKWDSN